MSEGRGTEATVLLRFQAILGHTLHQLFVGGHQPVSITTSNPKEFRIALCQLSQFNIKVVIGCIQSETLKQSGKNMGIIKQKH